LVRRFSNPAVGDQVTRLCLDGTSKYPTYLVPSFEAQLDSGGPLRLLALALAGWCRYLRGVADDGSPIELAHDPFLPEAVDAARPDPADPAKFLRYTRALGPRLAADPRVEGEFLAALDSLDRIGSLATLAQWAAHPT
jgi:mannitol-1-phosphate/altronate dehydrogenase